LPKFHPNLSNFAQACPNFAQKIFLGNAAASPASMVLNSSSIITEQETLTETFQRIQTIEGLPN